MPAAGPVHTASAPASSMPATKQPPPGVVVLALTLLLGTQPITTDLYLPSLPSLPMVFGVSVATVQLTLSVMIMAFGVGQLVLGPVADRYGRRPVVMGGLLLYLACSVVAMLAPEIWTLVIARAGQGLGIAGCVVAARALIRDLYVPQDGARMMARALMWMSAIPLLAPVLGGWLETNVGWRSSFAAQSVYALVLLVYTLRRLPETAPVLNPDALQARQLIVNWWEIARNGTFQAYTATAGFSYAGLFSFIAGSSFVLVDVLGLSRQQYGFAFSFVVCGYLLGTIVCSRLVATRGLVGTLRIGASITLSAGLSMLGLALAGIHHPMALLLPAFAYMVAHGLHIPCSQAGMVGPFPTRAGAAAALSGFLMMVLAFAAGNAIGLILNDTVLPLAAAMAFWSVLAAGAARVWVGRAERSHG